MEISRAKITAYATLAVDQDICKFYYSQIHSIIIYHLYTLLFINPFLALRIVDIDHHHQVHLAQAGN